MRGFVALGLLEIGHVGARGEHEQHGREQAERGHDGERERQSVRVGKQAGEERAARETEQVLR